MRGMVKFDRELTDDEMARVTRVIDQHGRRAGLYAAVEVYLIALGDLHPGKSEQELMRIGLKIDPNEYRLPEDQWLTLLEKLASAGERNGSMSPMLDWIDKGPARSSNPQPDARPDDSTSILSRIRRRSPGGTQ